MRRSYCKCKKCGKIRPVKIPLHDIPIGNNKKIILGIVNHGSLTKTQFEKHFRCC